MTNHSWRSYLTAEEAKDVLATEKHIAWASERVKTATKTKARMFWRKEWMAAKGLLSAIRNRAVKRAAVAQINAERRRSSGAPLAPLRPH